jgi:nucleoid-associated protein YgaU
VQDRQEESSPLMRRARARADEGDVDAAIRLYKAALEDNERLARAHLDLALLLNDHKKDYVRAIYHYQRYIELRPDAEKNKLIEDRIRLAGQQYAARINRPDKREVDRESLEKENAELKEALKSLKDEVARLRKQTAEVEPAQQPERVVPPVAAVVPAPEQRIPSPPVAAVSTGTQTPDANRIRTYRVKRGDTLMRIAGEVYGDSTKWKKIQDANRRALSGTAGVKVGQVLVIP